MSYDLFVFAGEVSGDLHGEKLLKELYAQRPDLKVVGVGGPKMRAVGMECILPMEEFEVMGFVDILSSLPKLRRHFKKIEKEILKNKPKGVVCIDYPGFNLRLANALRKKKSSAKRIHYICPTVWAWGKRRIPKMEKSLDELLTILPFEPDLFSKQKLNATYVGHPLISRIENHEYDPIWHKGYGLAGEEQILSIFPGSREKELVRNFPTQLKVAQEIQREYPDLTIAVSCSNEKFLPLLKKEKVLVIKPEHRYELMRASHLAIATSGTVTLELALHHIPTVVTFAITPLDVFLAQNVFQINLPHYALPNIIHKGELFPELFGPSLTEAKLRKKVTEFMVSEYKRSSCIETCKKLRATLGKKNASQEAARIILTHISKEN
ncbi:lipid-A-disaccharide synthase [Candidatus Neptunochlamydia vexilliferae]|nr:lipid-A-disaccharide synthase [Candidatus Neptunochlamydia vexilliferae]